MFVKIHQINLSPLKLRWLVAILDLLGLVSVPLLVELLCSDFYGYQCIEDKATNFLVPDNNKKKMEQVSALSEAFLEPQKSTTITQYFLHVNFYTIS